LEEVLNRNELKTIVKECLLEILMEGAGGNVQESVGKRGSLPSAPVRKTQDLMSYAPSRQQAPPQRQQSRPVNKDAFRVLANGNDVMASIFADTAASGLVENLGDPGSARPGSNPVVDTGVDPSVFEGASNWALLAFNDKTARRNG
jgi:hypothetical protein